MDIGQALWIAICADLKRNALVLLAERIPNRHANRQEIGVGNALQRFTFRHAELLQTGVLSCLVWRDFSRPVEAQKSRAGNNRKRPVADAMKSWGEKHAW